jgi:ABC-type sulfate/molybdate transport systems ATPase subunit
MSTHRLLEAHHVSGPLDAPRIHQADLGLGRGELLHVHGPSGSGKTTLLRLLARLDPLHEGTLRLDGQDAKEIPLTTWRRRVSLVFQESRVFAMSISENLQWGARQHDMHAEVPDLLQRVGLDVDQDAPASRLSGGEAKRLAIARALAVRPDVLLLDEPTGPLDEDNRDHLRSAVHRLQEGGLAIIFVSHLEEDLRLLPGHAVHLEAGRIRDEGPSPSLGKRIQEQR